MDPCRILIIDDDVEDIEILSEALQSNGVTDLHTVHTAKEAIDYLKNFAHEEELPKLIVTDLYLPVVNGIKFISDLKNDELLKRIPVIVFSTLKFEMVEDIDHEIGADYYIKKPNTYREYMEIAAYLNRKSAA